MDMTEEIRICVVYLHSSHWTFDPNLNNAKLSQVDQTHAKVLLYTKTEGVPSKNSKFNFKGTEVVVIEFKSFSLSNGTVAKEYRSLKAR
ncbi:hypothetical protein BGX31_011066 [Mortierella sp. GBA43]|nr:hypothetical protein BGX31_011066 [Mortierella sp. GBA43]